MMSRATFLRRMATAALAGMLGLDLLSRRPAAVPGEPDPFHFVMDARPIHAAPWDDEAAPIHEDVTRMAQRLMEHGYEGPYTLHMHRTTALELGL